MGAVIQSGNADFPTVADINTTGFRFLDVTDTTPGPGNGILLREIDAPGLVASVPEPGTLATFSTALLGLGLICWFRRRGT